MAELEELERYFDVLIHDGGKISSDHPLADDNKRYLFYKKLKSKITLEVVDTTNLYRDTGEPR